MRHHTIQLTLDGNAWIALLGPNLQDGIGGVGDTPAEAFRDLTAAIEKRGWAGEGIRLSDPASWDSLDEETRALL